MAAYLQRELDHLKRQILAVSALVEGSVQKAVKAFHERDMDLARKVVEADLQIDQMEVDVEEECLKILALHQPVAIDLRFIIAVLKINNDLERIGDLAVNIAERALLLKRPAAELRDFDLKGMAAKAQQMLQHSLDAVVNLDVTLARKVCTLDDEVDEANGAVATQVKQRIQDSPQDLDDLTHLMLVARHIERIADLATNIAEDAIYMVSGEIIRHRAHISDA